MPTTNTDYVLDATSEQVLAQLAQAAGNLERVSTARDHETIAFTAAEGSGNTLTVTTTDEGLPTVVSFFAQTTLTNVALTINGTAYDFTPAIGRSEEVCALSETTPCRPVGRQQRRHRHLHGVAPRGHCAQRFPR